MVGGEVVRLNSRVARIDLNSAGATVSAFDSKAYSTRFMVSEAPLTSPLAGWRGKPLHPGIKPNLKRASLQQSRQEGDVG
ncbi:hypothetical protein SPHV1_1790003 [Novosphingobium sp. KN65.2]|nr:hypothetical protein SPHV1_1790003 [Novosphingobium sp. KN65.2]